jgi:DNA-binding NarL/FixJ family response regulator
MTYITVVLADDNPKFLEVLARFLQPLFSIVAQVENGDLAFKAIKEFRPQLAILDVSMPKISGFEVARRLMETKSSTKVVFLTFLSGEDFIDEARRCGHGYVAKMRVHSDLLPAMGAALRGEFFASEVAGSRVQKFQPGLRLRHP